MPPRVNIPWLAPSSIEKTCGDASSDLSDCSSSLAPSESVSLRDLRVSQAPMSTFQEGQNIVEQSMQVVQRGLHEAIRIPAEEAGFQDSGPQRFDSSATAYTDSTAISTPPRMPRGMPVGGPVLKHPRILRRSKQSLFSYDSNLTALSSSLSSSSFSLSSSSSSSSSTTPSSLSSALHGSLITTECSDGWPIRLTKAPKHEPLFQYTDWEGNVRPTRVRGPPPLSYNHYLRYADGQRLATTNVVVDAITDERISPYSHGETNGRLSYRERDEVTVKNPDLVNATHRSLKHSNDRALSRWNYEEPKQIEKYSLYEDYVHFGPGASTEQVSITSSHLSTPTPQKAKAHFQIPPAASVSDHRRNVSDGSTNSTSSIRTDKLPSVTDPRGLAAYYGRYLQAASSLASSRNLGTTPEHPPLPAAAPFPRMAGSLAKHSNAQVQVFPPQVDKPLPQIPTPHGCVAPAQARFVAAAAGLDQAGQELKMVPLATWQLEDQILPAAAMLELSAPRQSTQASPHKTPDVPQVSYWSDSDDDEDMANAKIREIDHNAFGRAKYMHMRPGCRGWEEYRNRMLEESRGATKRAGVNSKSKRMSSLFGRSARKLSIGW